MPKTRFGKWSIGLLVAFFSLFAIGNVIVAIQGPIAGQTFFSNPILSIPMLSSGASAIAAFFTGIISIWKQKERSVFVFVSSIIGLFILIFVLGEILYPH